MHVTFRSTLAVKDCDWRLNTHKPRVADQGNTAGYASMFKEIAELNDTTIYSSLSNMVKSDYTGKDSLPPRGFCIYRLTTYTRQGSKLKWKPKFPRLSSWKLLSSKLDIFCRVTVPLFPSSPKRRFYQSKLLISIAGE